MLHRQSVSAELLGLLEAMMFEEAFLAFRLAGGTALALQLGHRHSEDIDLFGTTDFRQEELLNSFKKLGRVESIATGKSTLAAFVNDVKIDVVNYPYPWLDPILEIENIRMASLRDISVMKVVAITNRGSKKDFIDLYYLLDHFTLEEMLDNYTLRISDANLWLALRSMIYFEDADQQPMPQVHTGLTWQEVKTRIAAAVKGYR